MRLLDTDVCRYLSLGLENTNCKFSPCSTLCIINFLKVVRPDASDEVGIVTVAVCRLLTLTGADLLLLSAQMRDHGVCLFLLRRFVEAVPWLEKYLEVRCEQHGVVAGLIVVVASSWMPDRWLSHADFPQGGRPGIYQRAYYENSTLLCRERQEDQFIALICRALKTSEMRVSTSGGEAEAV